MNKLYALFNDKYRFTAVLEPTDRLVRWSGTVWYAPKDVPDLWAEAAALQCSRGDGTVALLLLPARPHSSWWFKHVVDKAASIYFLKQLVDGQQSAVVVWDGLARSQRDTITWYIDWKG